MEFPPQSPPCSPKHLRLQGPLWYDKEPCRKAGLIINSREPFNAEPPLSMLSSSYLTNEDIFYKRNHGPVPILPDPTTLTKDNKFELPRRYNLIVTGFVPDSLSISLDFLKSLPRYTVVATLQCAGNRRTEMSRRRRVRGLGWGPGAIGTGILPAALVYLGRLCSENVVSDLLVFKAAWGGSRLADVLKLAGVEYHSDITTRKGRHVEFVSCDFCKEEDGLPYRASIPMLHATTPESDVLLAYEMNGKVLSRDHGYPLRAIVPGVIGARSVKWIETIIISRFESQSFFQQKDYKMFPPDVDWHNVKWQSSRPLMDFPINSVICEPRDGVAVKSGDMVDLYGYAVAGGGRGIEGVYISIDNGEKWMEALRLPKQQIEAQAGYEDDPLRPQWAWTLWQLKFVNVDTAGNVQPADVGEIWNLRGVLNNCWYKIRINALCPPPVVVLPPPELDWAKNAAENETSHCKSPEDHGLDKPPPDVLDKF